ncbi:hypothetical protein ACTFIW_003350 [Dictyostelium discoideum]
MTPAFTSPAVIIPEDSGPIRRDIIRGISDSIASNMESAAYIAGEKIIDTLQEAKRTASRTESGRSKDFLSRTPTPPTSLIYFCFDRAAAYREISLIEEKNCTEMAAFLNSTFFVLYIICQPIQNKLNNTLALHTSKKGANRSTEFLYEIEEDQYPTLFFRAQKQLSLWSEALNIEIVAGKDIGDSAAVAFDTASSAKAGKICQKAYGEISISVPHETFLVLDATTIQNGLEQAKAFHQATPITVKFIVIGEKPADLIPFDPELFVQSMLYDEKEPLLSMN